MISVAVLVRHYRAYVRLPMSYRDWSSPFFDWYACHTVCSFVPCNDWIIKVGWCFDKHRSWIASDCLSPGITNFEILCILYRSTKDRLNWNIFHCYGWNHNATSHAGSIERGMRTIKGKWRTWDMHAPGYVKCKKQEAGSRNRATMITMMKVASFVSPYKDTSQSSGDSRRK